MCYVVLCVLLCVILGIMCLNCVFYDKTFRSDLSTQKNLSFEELHTTSYFLLLFVRAW